MKVSIEELVAVVDVKLASLEGAFGVGRGGSRSSPVGGALYRCEVTSASAVVEGVGLGWWPWTGWGGLDWCCGGGGLTGTGE